MSEETKLCEESSCKQTGVVVEQCSNHCQMFLCSEHLKEHENSFLLQYENRLNEFHQLLNKCLENVEEEKIDVESRYQRDLLKTNERYHNQLNLLDEKSLLINSSENLIKKKLQLLLHVKNARAILHQYDLEQIYLYQSKVTECISSENDSSSMTMPEENDDDDDEDDEVKDDSFDLISRDEIERFRSQCPLTQIGVFGLLESHRVRLCTDERAQTPLFLLAHFHRYHHLTWSIAFNLTKLVKRNVDRWKTPLFEADIDPIDPRFRLTECPMNKIDSYRKTSFCRRMFHRESMKQHLINYHHLSLITANKIMQAMLCEHPICSKPVHSICTTHCQWSLCVEHSNEHRQNLLLDFERSLRELMKPTSELSQLVEEKRRTNNDEQKRQIEQIENRYREEIDQIEEHFAELDRLEEKYQQIVTSFEQMKSNRKLLTRDDFHNLDRLTNQLNSHRNSTKNEKNDVIQTSEPFYCPLTSLNLFGLKSEHKVRLCPSGKKIRNLHEHFRNYHHLNDEYADAIMKAINTNCDPTSTKIFPDNVDKLVLDERFPCPFNETEARSGIRSTPCSRLLTDKSIRQHLKFVHRLSSRKISKILQMN